MDTAGTSRLYAELERRRPEAEEMRQRERKRAQEERDLKRREKGDDAPI